MRALGFVPRTRPRPANVSWPRYSAWRDDQQSLLRLRRKAFTGFTLTAGRSGKLRRSRVTSNSSPRSVSSRCSAASSARTDDRPGGQRRGSESSLWQKNFGGDKNILGQSITSTAHLSPSSASLPAMVIPLLTDPSLAAASIRAGRPRRRHHRTGHGLSLHLGRHETGRERAQAEEQLHVIDRRYNRSIRRRWMQRPGWSVFSFHEDWSAISVRCCSLSWPRSAVSCAWLARTWRISCSHVSRRAEKRSRSAVRSARAGTHRPAIPRREPADRGDRRHHR